MTLSEFFQSEQSLCFLAGAGVSHDYPSNLPLAKCFVTSVLDILPLDPAVREEFGSRLAKSELRFEQFIQALSTSYQDDEFEIFNLFAESTSSNHLHYFLAAAIARDHTVLTTNFDSLIERAARNIGLQLCLAYDRDSALACLDQAVPRLWKLHGTLEDISGARKRQSIVTTIDSVGREGEGFSLSHAFREVIHRSLKLQDLVVLGYSGSDDYDIVPALAQVNSTRRILWVWHEDSDRHYEVVPYLTFIESREHARAVIGKLAEYGNWKHDQLFCVAGNTAEIVKEMSRNIFGNLPIIKYDNTYNLSSYYFSDWKYRFALEAWRTDCFASDIYCMMGDHTTARGFLLRALAQVSELNEPVWQNMINRQLARVCILLGQEKEALDCLNAVESLHEQYRDVDTGTFPDLGTLYYQNRAICYTELGQIDKAREALARAAQGAGNEIDACILYEQGRICFILGDRSAGIDLIEESLRIHRQDGKFESIARCLNILAEQRALGEEYGESLTVLSESLRICRLISNSYLLANCLEVRAQVYRRLGLIGLAFEDLKEAEAIYRIRLKSARDTALICAHIASLAKFAENLRTQVCPGWTGKIRAVFVLGVGTIYTRDDAPSVKVIMQSLLEMDGLFGIRTPLLSECDETAFRDPLNDPNDRGLSILEDEVPEPDLVWAGFADQARAALDLLAAHEFDASETLREKIEKILVR